MAATKNVIAGSPSAADTLELGVSGGYVQVAAGVDFYLADVGPITGSATNTQAGGTALSYTINNVTSGADTHAVTLPVAVVGMVRIVYVGTGAFCINIFPNVGASINGGTGDASIAIKEKTWAIFIAVSTTNWISQYTVNT